MNLELRSLGLRLDGHDLMILDQRFLPDTEHWVSVKDPYQMVSLIRSLAVRGAPLIGVAAALSLGLYANSGSKKTDEMIQAAHSLGEARPTAVNLAWAIQRMRDENPDWDPAGLMKTAVQIFYDDVQMCESMAHYGAPLIRDGDSVLTICNSGGLATVGVGTALGVIRRAFEQGKNIHVYFCETRPLLQGARLTAWELLKLKIPHTLICDSMIGSLMAQKKIQKCFVGADRIAKNGDFANKIGTYNMAVLAHHHRIPFFAVAPSSTVDSHCVSGAQIPIEDREGSEVRGFTGSFGPVRWAPEGCHVFNPAFDMTPVSLLSGIILDTGVRRFEL